MESQAKTLDTLEDIKEVAESIKNQLPSVQEMPPLVIDKETFNDLKIVARPTIDLSGFATDPGDDDNVCISCQ